MTQIIKTLQKLNDTGEQPYAKVCTVHRVDKENKRCDVIPVDGTAELFDIPFQADVEGTGLCFYPAEDSKVLVVFINKHHACICNVSEVDLLKLAIDKMEFSVDKDALLLKNEEMEFLIDKDKLNLKKDDVKFVIDQAGLNLEKGKVKFSITQGGFQLKTEAQSLKKLIDELLEAIAAITVTSSPTGGLTGPPMNAATFTAIQTKFNSLLKD
ncbi:MAG: hypothetical protein E6Q66_05825 [Pedobacter sp.]|nr:MAG: hypothetical protein E6Q66_05825 [Pedobacter sp.]